MSVAGGISVSVAEWGGFLEATVTPRFPQGLSVTEASGQWRGADGVIVREPTHVLHLVHADDARSEMLVGEIVAAYKSQFQQEAGERAVGAFGLPAREQTTRERRESRRSLLKRPASRRYRSG